MAACCKADKTIDKASRSHARRPFIGRRA